MVAVPTVEPAVGAIEREADDATAMKRLEPRSASVTAPAKRPRKTLYAFSPLTKRCDLVTLPSVTVQVSPAVGAAGKLSSCAVAEAAIVACGAKLMSKPKFVVESRTTRILPPSGAVAVKCARTVMPPAKEPAIVSIESLDPTGPKVSGEPITGPSLSRNRSVQVSPVATLPRSWKVSMRRSVAIAAAAPIPSGFERLAKVEPPASTSMCRTAPLRVTRSVLANELMIAASKRPATVLAASAFPAFATMSAMSAAPAVVPRRRWIWPAALVVPDRVTSTEVASVDGAGGTTVTAAAIEPAESL